MPARHAILLTEHTAKHAHPERASRAEGSLLAASLPIPVRFTQLLSRRQPASISPLAATLMDLPASVANKRLTAWLSPLDATLTKKRGVGVFFPFWNSSQLGVNLSFQSLTHCTFYNPFVFTFMHVMGGVPPGASIFPTPTRREAEESRPSASSHRYFLTSLLHYFLLPLQSLRFHPGEK